MRLQVEDATQPEVLLRCHFHPPLMALILDGLLILQVFVPLELLIFKPQELSLPFLNSAKLLLIVKRIAPTMNPVAL